VLPVGRVVLLLAPPAARRLQLPQDRVTSKRCWARICCVRTTQAMKGCLGEQQRKRRRRRMVRRAVQTTQQLQQRWKAC
jgi:hypothetical protein